MLFKLTKRFIPLIRNYKTNKIHKIIVNFEIDNAKIKVVKAEKGINMLELAHNNDIDLEGACEGGLACSTCHLIVEDQEYFDKLPEATEDEEDMLDLAYGLTHTSRLGCQIKATPELDGIKLIVPDATRNMMVDKKK